MILPLLRGGYHASNESAFLRSRRRRLLLDLIKRREKIDDGTAEPRRLFPSLRLSLSRPRATRRDATYATKYNEGDKVSFQFSFCRFEEEKRSEIFIVRNPNFVVAQYIKKENSLLRRRAELNKRR